MLKSCSFFKVRMRRAQKSGASPVARRRCQASCCCLCWLPRLLLFGRPTGQSSSFYASSNLISIQAWLPAGGAPCEEVNAICRKRNRPPAQARPQKRSSPPKIMEWGKTLHQKYKNHGVGKTLHQKYKNHGGGENPPPKI